MPVTSIQLECRATSLKRETSQFTKYEQRAVFLHAECYRNERMNILSVVCWCWMRRSAGVNSAYARYFIKLMCYQSVNTLNQSI